MPKIYLVNSPEHIGPPSEPMANTTVERISALSLAVRREVGTDVESVYSSYDPAAMVLAHQIMTGKSGEVRLVDALTPSQSLEKLVGTVHAMEELYEARAQREKLETLARALNGEYHKADKNAVCVTHDSVIQAIVDTGLIKDLRIINLPYPDNSFTNIAA